MRLFSLVAVLMLLTWHLVLAAPSTGISDDIRGIQVIWDSRDFYLENDDDNLNDDNEDYDSIKVYVING
jgi:hypothetical protein